MTTLISKKEAGALLVSALRSGATGFIARVTVPPFQRRLAIELATSRRVLAKLWGMETRREYATAYQDPVSAYEQGRLRADRRGILAELIVGDLIRLSGADESSYAFQPLVSFKPESEPDIQFEGKLYDVKSASQAAADWSPNPVSSEGRFRDDRGVAVNEKDHSNYMLTLGSVGYVFVYFYVEAGEPVSADVFVYTLEQVSAVPVTPGSKNCREKDYRLYPVAFPDNRYREGSDERRSSLAAAGYYVEGVSPFTAIH